MVTSTGSYFRNCTYTRMMDCVHKTYLGGRHGDELDGLLVPELQVAPLPHRKDGLRARHAVVGDQNLPGESSKQASKHRYIKDKNRTTRKDIA